MWDILIVKNIILDIKNPFLLEIRLFLYKKTIFWNQKVDILSKKKKKIKNEVHVHALMNHKFYIAEKQLAEQGRKA